MRLIVFIICIVVLVALFLTQNSQPVAVSFFAWKFQASLAIVVFLSALSGVIIGVVASFFVRLAKKRKEPDKTDPGTIRGPHGNDGP